VRRSAHIPKSEPGNLDPPMPQDIDLEKGIVGAILRNPEELPAALEEVEPGHFFHEEPRRVYKTLIALAEAGAPLDFVTVGAELHRTAKSNDVPLEYKDLHELEAYVDTRSVRHYAGLVKKMSLQRDLIHASFLFYKKSFNGNHAEAFERLLQANARLTDGDPGKAAMSVCTPAEWKALGGDAVEYFVYPLAARGLVTLLDGAAKAAGKTTLLLTGIAASLRENLFLNRPTKIVRILYVTEENPRTFRMALARAGLADETRFHIMPFSSYAGRPWPQVTRAIEAKCVELKIDWLIVDTFFAVAGLGGETENQAGAVDDAVAPLRSIVGRLDIALTLTRHTRKSGGPIGESGRGSSALTGAADSIIELKRLSGSFYPERRQLEVTGRVESAFLEIELRNGLYIVSPEAEVDNSTDEADRVAIAISANRAASIRELEQITGIGKNRITKLAGSKGWRKEGDKWLQNLS
jgi:hypothetical protein